MAKKTFADKLDEILRQVPGKALTRYDKTKERLREFCRRLQEGLAKQSGHLLVSLQPGFQAETGQQLNVVVEVPARGYRSTLFRAYVPLEGVPVYLDFYGEEAVRAETLDQMEAAIVEFMSEPRVQSRLSDYRDLAGT